jgi:ketosteroid isomerase-like protein
MSWQTVIAIISIATAESLVAADAPVEIRAVMDRQVTAWNRGDIDGYMDGYVRSDKLEFVSGGKITRGWQTVRDRYHRKYSTRDAMGTLKFSDIEIRMLKPDIAIVAGRWELVRKNDRPHGSFVLTFRHQPEGWRIVHDNTS